MSLFLILLAGGDSKRLKSYTPKQFQVVNNATLLEHSFNAFKEFREIKKTIIVYNNKHAKYIKNINFKNVIKVIGGKNRQESAFAALKKIKSMNCKKVLIHDAARPHPSKSLIKNIINKLKNNSAVIPVLKVTDATKRINKNLIFKNIKRNNLMLAQTPQGFDFKKIYSKHLINQNYTFDDDSAMFTKDSEKVFATKGSRMNLKITDKEDLNIFKSLLKGKIFYGIGFDIHKLTKNRKLYLGGINIPYQFGLEGHSDGDSVIHAIIDSLLGASNLGDIGKLFSDKDKKTKSIRSTLLLKRVIKLLNNKKILINNIDVNIIAQRLKVSKYSYKMIKALSKICKIKINQINIKGKTTEKMGLIGNGKAIASEVISSVIKYD